MYAFDILARIDGNQVNHVLGIDFVHSATEVGLSEVALFDTKAYDCGVDDKVIVVSPTLTREARQFARHQRIRVLEHDDRMARLAAAVITGVARRQAGRQESRSQINW